MLIGIFWLFRLATVTAAPTPEPLGAFHLRLSQVWLECHRADEVGNSFGSTTWLETVIFLLFKSF